MQKKSRGGIFVISAPSGAGKTTICKKILSRNANIKQSVSFTTRKPRKGEKNGADYYFVAQKTFQQMISRNEFIEWAEVHGNFYGTSRKKFEGLVSSGFDVILDIDTQGARQIRNSFSEGVFIFILPPSIKVLRERLQDRKSNTKKDMQRRLKRAAVEIKDYNMYDYVIVNDILGDSVKKLEAIITARRLSSDRVDPKWIKDNFLR
ncbi:MAG TPA: guanylate kinase [Candidatus Sulfobium mesophilum]|nr:guanylate kinase [Candidatus Sulfobium mesophilum]